MYAGDVLVLEATTDFINDFGSSHYFALVSGCLYINIDLHK